MKKIVILLTAIVISLLGVSEVKASGAECTEWSASNKSGQNYSIHASTIDSYLFEDKDGYMRVQYDMSKGLFVEYYDSEYQLLEVKTIAQELPIFGGIYKTDSNFYLVTGQSNLSESADVEVFRITKYDTNWNRISSVGLYDCNTTTPFASGTVRMTDDGKYLLIRTSHRMYASTDGLNHQANVTIQVDMDQMKITSSFTDVMNTRYGYVSHSFNQFVKIDNGKLVTLDHGDAYPRSFVLINYASNVSTGNFLQVKNCTVTDVMQFEGAIGNNTTNATAGGFEVTPSTYLMAGNSVIQDSGFASYSTRNIFVASINKSTKSVTTTWLTDYAEGETTTKTPQMVKITDDKYLVLWERGSELFYVTVNAQGTKTSQIYSFEGNLSDCVPLLADGKIIWYVCSGSQIDFYQINSSDLSDITVTNRENGHDYQAASVSDGVAKVKCTKCEAQKEAAVPSTLKNYWNTTGSGTYSSVVYSVYKTGSSLYLLAVKNYTSSLPEYFSDIAVTASDDSLVSITEEYSDKTHTYVKIDFCKAGTVTLTIAPKYNAELGKTYTFHIYDPLKMESFTTDCGNSVKYANSVMLKTEISGGYTGSSIKYTYTAEDEAGNVETLASKSTESTLLWTPKEIGNYKLTVSATDGETTVKKTIEDFQVTKGSVSQPSDLNQKYVYGISFGSLYLCSQLLPSDCGNVQYSVSDIEDSSGILYDITVSEDGKLNYYVNKTSQIGDMAEFVVKCSSERYEDVYLKICVSITDKKQTLKREGCEPEASKTLIYGQKLSEIEVKNLVFEDVNGEEVKGTVNWVDETLIPNAGEQVVGWEFVPENAEYSSVQGTLSIVVEKAEIELGKIEKNIIYNPALTLKDIDFANIEAKSVITGEKVEGEIIFDNPETVPVVNQKEYPAKFIPTGEFASRYREKECIVSLNVEQVIPVITGEVSVTGLVYGQSLEEAVISGIYATCGENVVNGTFSFKNPNVKPAVADSVTNNNTKYEIIFTPDDGINYKSVDDILVSILVEKCAEPPVKPEATMTVDHQSAKVSDVSLPEGWEWHVDDMQKELPVGSTLTATAVFKSNENYLEQEMEVQLTRKAHQYKANFTWSGYTKAEAIISCESCDESHVTDAEISVEKTPATMSKSGSKIYTADVEFDGQTFTDSKKVIINKATVTLSTTSYTYNGKTKKPSVSVKAGSKKISTSNYSVSYASGRKKVGKYAVKVTFKNDYTGSKTLYFKINPKATSVNSLSAGKKNLTVKWKKQSTEVTGYQIQYSTSKSFKKSTKTVTVKSAKTTRTTIKKLQSKKKYYVRIRTYKTVKGVKYYSSWSKYKYAKVK